MSVGCHHLSQCLLVFAPSLHPLAHLLNQMLWDVLNLFLAAGHEGQRPDQMSLALGAVAVWLATAQLLPGKRTGKKVVRELESADQIKLALANPGCLGSFRLNFHLIVILH